MSRRIVISCLDSVEETTVRTRAILAALLPFALWRTWPQAYGGQLPELGVEGPVCTPVRHQPFWRLEPEQFGYRPRFVSGVVTFDLENRPYMRSEYTLQTLDAEGRWTRLDFEDSVQKKYPKWDGKLHTGAFTEEHTVFDTRGAAYLIANATRSSLGKILLLHSTDGRRSWSAYEIGRGFARLERSDGHNDFSQPPPVLVYEAGRSGLLQLVVPKRRPDNTLDVSTVKVVSRDSYLVPNHSGGGNSLCSQGDLIHIVWPGRAPIDGQPKAGTPQYAATYDRKTGSLTKPAFLGFGGTGRPDPHNMPAIAADSKGYLHVVMGAHHDPFRYARSLKPRSTTSGWTAPVEFGAPKPSPNEGSYTYAGWICDADDTLHCAARWAGAGYTFRLVYLRKKAGSPWEDQQYLICPFAGNYSIYYHKMNLDRRGRLFINYVTTRTNRFPDEMAAYSKKWPAEDSSSRFPRKHPGILMSDDHGDSWRLAVTDDLIPAPPGEPRVRSRSSASGTEKRVDTETEGEKDLTPTATMLRQIGGAFGPVALVGDLAYVGVGNSLVILEVSEPSAVTVVGQTAPLADSVLHLRVKLPYVYVSAWRDGFVVYDVSAPAQPKVVGRDRKTEARGFDIAGDLLYLTTGRGGLRVFDASDPAKLREVGSFRTGEAYDAALVGDVAYLALGRGGLEVLDVGNPTSPKEIVHLLKPADYADRMNTIWYLTASDERLYLSPGPAEVCLRIFDVASPRQPKELGRLARPWGWGRRTAVIGNLVYFPGLTGFHVLDVSDPAQVRELGSTGSRSHSVAVSGNRACVTSGAGGLAVLDVSDPTSPKSLGHYEYPKLPFDLAIAGDRAYVADWSVGLHIFDVADPALPTAIGHYKKERWALGVAASGKHAYVAAGKEGLVVLDVSDPAQPRQVGLLETKTGIRDVAVLGRHAFVAEADLGVRVIGISAPSRPVAVASFKTPRQALGVAAAEGRLYIAEAQWIKGGVQVCEVSEGGRLKELGCIELDSDVWNVAVSGDCVYAAMAKDGVRVLDVKNPRAIRDLGRLQPRGTIFWAVAQKGELLYAACGSGGLNILKLPVP